MNATRRKVVKTLAAGGAAVMVGTRIGFAQAPKEVKITELSKLAKDFDAASFEFDGSKSLLVRIPAPTKLDARTLEVTDGGKKIYLTAYTLVCTHLGCVPGLPNKDKQLVCACHGSTFAADGSVVKGPARQSLEGIKLEVRQGSVFAVARLESR